MLPFERGNGAGENFFGRSAGVNRSQQTKILVEIDQGSGAALIDLHSDRDRFGAIVLSLIQPAAAVLAVRRGAVSLHVEDGFALLADAASVEPGYDFIKRQLVVDHRV